MQVAKMYTNLLKHFDDLNAQTDEEHQRAWDTSPLSKIASSPHVIPVFERPGMFSF